MDIAWMAWTWQTAVFFSAHRRRCSRCMTILGLVRPEAERLRRARHRDDARRPAVHLAARQRLHPSGVARARRAEPLVGARPVGSSTPSRSSVACGGAETASEPRSRAAARQQTRTGRFDMQANVCHRDGCRPDRGAGVGALRGRSGRGEALDRQRVPALHAVQGRSAEGDGVVHQGGRRPSRAWRSRSSPRPSRPTSTSRRCCAKAFTEITGIKVTHDIIQEGDVVEKIQTQMQSGRNIYDAWINDSRPDRHALPLPAGACR